MAEGADDMERFYDCGEKLATSSDKSKNEKEYLGIIEAAKGGNKAKLFASQQLPRFFKFFPSLSAEGINAQLDLCEDDDINIRMTAIRGLPFLCKDTPEHLPKIADVLGQLLIGEDQEHSVVENSLMQVLRQNPKDCLAAIFKHIESPEDKLRENVLSFIKNKVFPNKKSLLQPQAEMERHITDLIKGIQDVTGDEFAMFMEFLTSLNLFGPKATEDQMQELVGIIEGQADLNAVFDVEDADHLERVLACLHMAVPFFSRGGSNSNFMGFIGRHLLPSFSKLPAERKSELLKSFAEAAPFTTPADARMLLPPVVALLKEHVPRKKSSGEPVDLVLVEALLHSFNTLAQKARNATNALCGYKIVTGQPSDQLGKDFSELHEDWLARLGVAEEEAKKKLKAVAAEVQEVTKSLRTAKGEEADALKKKKADATQAVRCSSNIEKLIKGLKSKNPEFLSSKAAPRLSWLGDQLPSSGGPSVTAAAAAAAADTNGTSSKGIDQGKRKATPGDEKANKKQKQQQQQQQQQQHQQKQQAQQGGKQKQKQKQKQQQQQQQAQQQQLLQRQQMQQLQQLQQRQQTAALAAMAQNPLAMGAMAARSFPGMIAPGVIPVPMPMSLLGRGGSAGRGRGGGGRGRRGRR